jgi:addiction module HigA family antidote
MVIGKVSTVSESTSSGASASAGIKATHMESKSWTIIEEIDMKTKKMDPIHPGEILNEDFLKPMEISQYRLAKDISVPARRINEIVHGTRSITADTALRLGRYFGISAQFWLNLQSHYDLSVQEDLVGERLAEEVRVFAVA